MPGAAGSAVFRSETTFSTESVVFQAVFGQQPQLLPEIILATVILLAAFAVQDAIVVALNGEFN